MLRRLVVTVAIAGAIVSATMLAVTAAGLTESRARPSERTPLTFDDAGTGGQEPVTTSDPGAATPPTGAPSTAPTGGGSVTGSLPPTTGGGVTISVRPELPGGLIAEDVLSRINRERSERGLAELAIDMVLVTAAQEWAETMPTGGYRHSPQDRLQGILERDEAGAISEIIHAPETQCTGGGACADPAGRPTSGVLVIDWLRSGSHRSALLGDRWNRVGIGISCGDDGRVWAAVLFASAPGVYVDTGATTAYDEPRVNDNGGYTCDGNLRAHNPSWRHTPIS